MIKRQVIVVKTYCFKLYKAKRNRKLHKVINIAGIIYNHCIALHKRYYRLFKKPFNIYKLQKHLPHYSNALCLQKHPQNLSSTFSIGALKIP